MAEKTELEVTADQAAAVANHEHFDSSMPGNFAMVPDGYRVESLEGFQTSPNRIQAKHRFVETASLASYVNRFGTDDTMISADYDRAKIVAVIDGDGQEGPDFKEHVATFEAAQHETLKAWLGIEGRGQSQIAFGRFLEDRAMDVIQPDAASIMEMVMQFEATKKVEFKSSTRLHDGARQLQFVEDNEARGALTVPDHIFIRCPIFRGLDPQDIKFMLRYRIDEGKLVFQVEMHNKEEVLRDAFERCVDAFRVDLKSSPFVYITG